MRLRTWIVVACWTAASSFGASARSEDAWKPKVVEPAPDAPANECLEWKSPQGKPYWYRLPKKLAASRPASLVIMLHGTGMNQGWPFYNYPLLDGQWRKDDVILAPEGVTRGEGTTFNFVQGPADGEQIVALIELFKKKLPIGKVYLYGHSQGAFFCYWFAGEHPELVDGIVAHAGNVLSVKHSKLAKEKVAIGILHGRADAVVPVDCATRTEKVYRDEGYQKIKLYVVEGLNDQTGHWPLPKQVGEMLEWLDQVSTQSVEQAVSVAIDQLGRDEPDLAIVRGAIDSAQKLLAKAKTDEKAAATPRIALVRAFLEDAAAGHAAALLADPALANPKLTYGAWAAHFRIADRAFRPLASWQKSMKAACAAADKHDKLVEAALESVESGKAAGVKAAITALDQGYLASRYTELAGALRRAIASPPKGVGEKDVGAATARIDERTQSEADGAAAAAAKTKELVAALRTAHPELLAAEEPTPPEAGGGN